MKRPWVQVLARSYVRRRLARAMDGVWVHGLARARAAVAAGPVLLCATHAAWWDALVIVAVDEALGGDGYGLMDQDQLRKFPFFASIGAIGLDRTSPAAMRRGLKTALALLEGPRSVWIFPQGRHRPPHLRPLGLQRGHELLARGVTVLPVALTYAFREAPQPSAILSFEAPNADLEAGLIGGLDRIDQWVDTGDGAFEELIPARGSRIDRSPATRLLGVLTGRARG